MPHSTSPSLSNPIRVATLADLDSVLEVNRSKRVHEPQWHYRFQYYDQFRQDNEKYDEIRHRHFLNPSNDDWHVMLAEAPSLEDPGAMKIVAYAVWDVSYRNKRRYGAAYQRSDPLVDVIAAGGATRGDLNHQRESAVKAAEAKESKRCFDDVYGDEQLRLQSLGTHADYFRRGLAAQLAVWGVSLAKKEKLAITGIASPPMGTAVYLHVGAKKVAGIEVQLPEEEEKTCVDAMVLDLRKGWPSYWQHLATGIE